MNLVHSILSNGILFLFFIYISLFSYSKLPQVVQTLLIIVQQQHLLQPLVQQQQQHLVLILPQVQQQHLVLVLPLLKPLLIQQQQQQQQQQQKGNGILLYHQTLLGQTT